MASVRLENDAWTDPRYDHLAQLVGLDDGDFARVRCMRVWSYCTDRNESVLSEAVVDVLGKHKGFARAMIEAQLAEETKRGIRIKGSKGRIEWLASKRNNASKGGKAKASKRLASARESLEQKASTSSDSVAELPTKRLPSDSGSCSVSGSVSDSEKRETGAKAPGEARAARSTKPRVTTWRRFPPDYEPTPEHRALAVAEGVDLDRQLLLIRNHDFQRPRSDPGATLTNWILRARSIGGHAQPRPRGPAPVSPVSDFDDMLREQRGGTHA